MPADVLSRIFDPFFTTKDVGLGSGLGLSMVYGTVQQIGGAITVESTPGAGTTFTLYFPAAEPEAGPPAAEPSAVTHDATVLVVDDEPAARQLTATTLTRAGYRVLSASSGAEALEMAHAHRVDVLLTDLRMPGLHGRDLARAVQAIHSDAQVVLMSGLVSDEADPALTVVARLQKPFTQAALREAVHRAASRHARTVD
jgi:two-component system cell cycle sensor histidine kinase/response regulator CckA